MWFGGRLLPIETRLLAMLEGVPDLTLEQLNQATQAWIELEYHRRVHSETGQTPLASFLESNNVLRDCPARRSCARLSSHGAAHAAPQ